MRKIFLLLILCGCLKGLGQEVFDGRYKIEYDKEARFIRESKVKIWYSVDSVGKMLWSFTAFQNNKWMWEVSGTCLEKGKDSMELYASMYKDARPKVQTKKLKWTNKNRLHYIITRIGNVLYIESPLDKKMKKLRLIKE